MMSHNPQPIGLMTTVRVAHVVFALTHVPISDYFLGNLDQGVRLKRNGY